MATIKFDINGLQIKLDSDKAIYPSDQQVLLFGQHLDKVRNAIRLDSITLKDKGSGDYDFTINVHDGREWKHGLHIESGSPPEEAAVSTKSDGFKLSEFGSIRAFRLHLIRMIVDKGLNKLEITWA